MSSRKKDTSVLDLSYEDDKSYSEELEELIEEWSDYERALNGVEKDAFEKVKRSAKSNVKAGKEQDPPKEIEAFFISVLLEQQIEIDRLEKRLNGQKEVDEKY